MSSALALAEHIKPTLNGVQPYDWRNYLQKRVYELAANPPLEGINEGGYKLVYTAEPDTPTVQALGFLASWAVTQRAGAQQAASQEAGADSRR